MTNLAKICIAIVAISNLILESRLSAAQMPQGPETIALDGVWEIVFDPENLGRKAGWQRDDVFAQIPDRREIEVPGAWELIEKDYEGVAFYRREFEVPGDWAGRIVRLHFGAVNYLSEVWINDQVAGAHEGGFTPFEFRVDELIQPGENNVLILRVVGPIILSDHEVDGVGPLETSQWRGGITGGIWQPVRLEATGDVYVDDVFIEPDIRDRTTKLHVELTHTGINKTSAEMEIDIFEVDDPTTRVTQVHEVWELRPGNNAGRWKVSIPEGKLWSPDQPSLYRVTLRILVEGQQSDLWSQRFGLRELTIGDKGFYLNGKPLYIKATFFEGLYPGGIAYPDTEEMVRREIQLAKDAGFNMIRPWRRPPAPLWLDVADEMGVLVVGSPALECMRLPLSTPYLPSRVENEIRQAVLRDRNRACVVQWELFNELHRPILKQLMRPMAMLTRELDPTRLILDESGGWAFGANMYLPYEYEPTKFNDIHTYPGPFIDRELYDGFLAIGLSEQERQEAGLMGRSPGRNVVPGLMSFVSELGYGSLPDLVNNNQRFVKEGNPLTPAYRYHQRLAKDQVRVLQESGFAYLYPDLEQFCLDQQSIHGRANKRMIEAVRSNPNVDGYCIHALAAGDWILGAGLIDLWRNPKSYAYEATKQANQPRIVAIRVKPRNIYAEHGASLEVTGINDLEALDARLQVSIVSETGQTVFTEELFAEWDSGVSPLLAVQLETQNLQGSYTVRAHVYSTQGTILTKNSHQFDVFAMQDLQLPKSQIAVLDLAGSLTPFLTESGLHFGSFDDSTALSTPVFVTRTKTNTRADQRRFASLLKFVERGGTAVYIEGTDRRFARGVSNQVKTLAFPFSAEVAAAQGLWTCIPHLVRDHPIFEGLPVNTMMRDLYQNVWARQTLRNLQGEALIASIGFQWFSQGHKLHYSGPGESWWGADMAVVPLGTGRCLISQLRIVENLGTDPVADRLLFNIIRYLNETLPLASTL